MKRHATPSTLPLLLALAGAALVFSGSVAAQSTTAPPTAPGTATPGVDKRQELQQQRTDQGAAKGQLTPQEQQRLERRQGVVDKAETRAQADGSVTAQERRQLHRMQDRSSRAIHRQRHDGQKAGGG
ncbi:hypothetical protein [Aquabacterium sp. J223]|uniref:hypothetical protein n=1 Tax=Aquabacterium sp. J223 TaxID=2898431 RepID=UPI0021AD953F|nr:hypothetical protein [Aquabacterium sp. J223]UUX96228.1 hypothetical protein LRS07_02525 [Aquabacterium sp. J223]